MKRRGADYKQVMDAMPEPFVKPLEPALHQGKCIYYNELRSFGFVHSFTDNHDYFFHRRALLTPVNKDNKVTFRLDTFHDKVCAVEVQQID
jgi:cold shock CspA family protein